MATLGKLFTELDSLAKVSQLRWLTIPTKDIPLQFLELGMDLIVGQDGSWMKIMLKLELTSRTVLTIRLFFWMFCKKIFKSFKIILQYRLQLNELRFFSFPEAQHIPWNAICCSNHSPERHLWYADFSKALNRLFSSGNYKRTQQGALAALLLYLYKLHVVCATTISTGPYVHTSTSCPLTKATMPYTCALTSYS